MRGALGRVGVDIVVVYGLMQFICPSQTYYPGHPCAKTGQKSLHDNRVHPSIRKMLSPLLLNLSLELHEIKYVCNNSMSS